MVGGAAVVVGAGAVVIGAAVVVGGAAAVVVVVVVVVVVGKASGTAGVTIVAGEEGADGRTVVPRSPARPAMAQQALRAQARRLFPAPRLRRRFVRSGRWLERARALGLARCGDL